MARSKAFLTDEQWTRIATELPPIAPQPKGGSPPADNRKIVEGILWIL
jgi:hypothetical protein